ncbi:putative mediator of RNA polymerase II transcription subunit 8 [Ceratitis capitata]|uniref:putative mediator of RNA polymerase II transcription subunit 8 n=1 Tax=Ceratitis capitata TaxID=7213 RepID=UPI000329F6A5|nr:putative mediator of RNA polymerase II transcription subunit 8 [Ceratitis capitata]
MNGQYYANLLDQAHETDVRRYKLLPPQPLPDSNIATASHAPPSRCSPNSCNQNPNRRVLAPNVQQLQHVTPPPSHGGRDLRQNQSQQQVCRAVVRPVKPAEKRHSTHQLHKRDRYVYQVNPQTRWYTIYERVPYIRLEPRLSGVYNSPYPHYIHLPPQGKSSQLGENKEQHLLPLPPLKPDEAQLSHLTSLLEKEKHQQQLQQQEKFSQQTFQQQQQNLAHQQHPTPTSFDSYEYQDCTSQLPSTPPPQYTQLPQYHQPSSIQLPPYSHQFAQLQQSSLTPSSLASSLAAPQLSQPYNAVSDQSPNHFCNCNCHGTYLPYEQLPPN